MHYGTLVLNIKDNGIEDKVIIKQVMKAKIKSFFFTRCRVPIYFQKYKIKQKNIAIRFSEKEPIESAKLFQNNFKWLWIDTLTKLPLDKNNIKVIKNFKSCVVCPERWNRPDEIDIIKKNEIFKF